MRKLQSRGGASIAPGLIDEFAAGFAGRADPAR